MLKLKSLSIGLLTLVLSVAAFGQTAMTTTTLGAATTGTTSRGYVILASTTNVNAPATAISQGGIGGPASGNNNYTLLFVDQELMRVASIGPAVTGGTEVFVNRGYSGTPVQAHLNSAKVWVGPPSLFHNVDPPRAIQGGACGGATNTGTATQAYTPWIAYNSGDIWNCVNNSWQTFAAWDNTPVVGAAIASASTIAPLANVTHITGTTTVNTITLPPNFQSGECLYLIPDGLWSTGTSGNIAIASTGVVSKILIECYDASTSKFYPSY